jgi:dinuclear metal center YbgI/SA1388 family protein
MTTVADVIETLETRFPPELAEDWDRNGLVVGDPTARVERVLFAVDPTLAIAQEALEVGATMIVTHHPLLLRGVSTVATTTPGGAVVHRLIEAGCALYNAHTNADAAAGGVADALAEALGVTGTMPLVPSAADPTQGTGRVGQLASPTTLREFADHVAATLPATHHGVRVAGDLDAEVRTVAVVGGSGDAFLEQAAASQADVYVTADLRHHPASSAREAALLRDGRPYLVDVAHFASEWSWLTAAAEHVADATGIDTIVSTYNTDPWTAHVSADHQRSTRG